MIDETGKTYDRLKVIEQYDPKKHGEYLFTSNGTYWYCECDCGETTIVYGGSLRNSSTKSCGCLRKESTARNGRKNKGRKAKK